MTTNILIPMYTFNISNYQVQWQNSMQTWTNNGQQKKYWVTQLQHKAYWVNISSPSAEALAKCLTTIQAAIATATSLSLCYIQSVMEGVVLKSWVILKHTHTHTKLNSDRKRTRCLVSRSMQAVFSAILSLVRTHPLDKLTKTHRA